MSIFFLKERLEFSRNR